MDPYWIHFLHGAVPVPRFFSHQRSTYSDGADGEGTASASMAMGRRLRHGPHRQWPIWGGSIAMDVPPIFWMVYMEKPSING